MTDLDYDIHQDVEIFEDEGADVIHRDAGDILREMIIDGNDSSFELSRVLDRLSMVVGDNEQAHVLLVQAQAEAAELKMLAEGLQRTFEEYRNAINELVAAVLDERDIAIKQKSQLEHELTHFYDAKNPLIRTLISDVEGNLMQWLSEAERYETIEAIREILGWDHQDAADLADVISTGIGQILMDEPDAYLPAIEKLAESMRQMASEKGD